MVRASSSKKGAAKGGDKDDAESKQRKRLKTLALDNQLLSDSQAKSNSSLKPSKQVLKHHGTDIIRKSQRKNRFLFSFPGLLAPISGATIGDLDRLSTKNPVLYLNFPQGRMKLFGTILYPKNRYLTLQFSRGGKNVLCDDYFDNMIVFSESWWIGTKEENPEEARLNFPKELAQAEQTDFDFQGGAGGAASVKTLATPETGSQPTETDSPEVEMEDVLSDDGEFLDDKIQVTPPLQLTPVRQSQRNSGKKFNFAETSPEVSSDESEGNNTSDEDEKPQLKPESSTRGREESQDGTTASASKLPTELPAKQEKPKCKDSKLVQGTVANLFKKAEEKIAGTSKAKLSSKA
ncbi:PREDICTED: DNA-binding protein RHL1-like [Camelina sativa]|uniref:DNA-binding protein RHL1-like n=1 Tax=Camelina sativa TaxID=90675 RepID=A0ABM0VVF0_CAMSA|nr:PREDICTED: DNA-binding protein RHL1-like [Camelina sativa]